jgi:cytochrome c-type biogenesis protein CcmE
MLSKKTRTRIFLATFLLLALIVVVIVVLKSLEENVVYFFSPTELHNKEDISFNKKIRVGGLVKDGSIINNQTSINFIVTDLNNEIIVSYKGSLPNLFSEGKGVVAEGKLKDKKYFIADKILAKHDENYMPPEVSKILKKSKEQ